MKQTPATPQTPLKVSSEPSFLKKNKAFLLFLGVFAVAMTTVFLPVMSAWTVIASPDDAPFYPQHFLVSSLETLLSGGGAFTPFSLLNLLPQVGFHEMRYVLAMLLFGLSVTFYLRTQKLDRLPAYGAGLLLSFSGYIFTLFCAGHMGFFFLMGLFFWCFGLWNKALETGKWRYFLLFPACAMWAQAGQPDVWVLFATIFGVYALRGLWRARAQFLKLLPKLILSVVVAGLIGGSSIMIVLTQHLAGRDKQIADSSRTVASGQETPEAKQQKAEDRWIFATNWSLPLADSMELLIPGFFGDNAMTPPYPYWGALGRPYRFEPGKMMPNYRQHTTYLGLITVILALIGVTAWFAQRRKASPSSDLPGRRSLGEGGRPLPVRRSPEGEGGTSDLSSTYQDVPFWAGVWVVCLVLALGRYTPLYQLFYAIPYMDYLRAPVKFLHFTELATGLLAGFGMQALLSQRFSEKGLKRLLVAGGGVLLFFVVIWLGVSVSGEAIEKHITEIGLGQVASTLRGYTSYNCLRAIGLMALVLILFYVGWLQKGQTKKSTIILALLVGIGVFDLAAVARRYVMPINVQAHHEENVIVKEMKRATQGRPAFMANYVTRNVSIQDWLNTSLSINGYMNVLPDETDSNSKVRPLAIALQKEPLRYWELTGPRFVLLSRQQATQVMQMQLAKPLAEFELGQGSVRRSSTPSERSILLMERTRQPIYPCVFFNWTGGVKPDDQITQLVKLNTANAMMPTGPASLLVSDAPAPTATVMQPPQGVTFTQMRGEENVFITRATVQLSQPGLLVWNERYSADLKATLDNKEVPLYQANGQWCAIQVPAGKHTLTCQARIKGCFNLISMATSLFVLVVCGFAMWCPLKRPEASKTDKNL
jgi:hypothetical protein